MRLEHPGREAVLFCGVATRRGEDFLRVEGEDGTVLARISEETSVVDAISGKAAAPHQIEDGEQVCVYVSPVMTRSFPPQAGAYVVIRCATVHCAPPVYSRIEEVTRREDGGFWALTDRDVNLRLSAETELWALDGTALSPANLKPGDMVLAWYQAVALSFPAQATPGRVAVLSRRG